MRKGERGRGCKRGRSLHQSGAVSTQAEFVGFSRKKAGPESRFH